MRFRLPLDPGLLATVADLIVTFLAILAVCVLAVLAFLLVFWVAMTAYFVAAWLWAKYRASRAKDGEGPEDDRWRR